MWKYGKKKYTVAIAAEILKYFNLKVKEKQQCMTLCCVLIEFYETMLQFVCHWLLI